jgi:glycosyltransferase involved in cell wall biosynthesis
MADKRLKIAYITSTDARSRHAWSGTQFSIWKTLQDHVGDIDLIGPVKPFFALWVGKIATGLSQKIFHKRYNYRHSRLLARGYARIVNRQLSKTEYNIIVIPGTSTFIPFLKTNTPIVYIGDSTVKGSMNYHKALTNVFPFSIRETLETEKCAFEKAKFLIFPSEWAAKSAINDFNIDPAKVFVMPFGPNIEALPSREMALTKQKNKECRLLFIGVNWRNKGGPIAFDTLLELNKMGISTHLTVCGCTPPNEFKHPNLTVIPFLNKDIKEEQDRLNNLFLHSDFFVLPTRFEAFGIVFCEASAFGVPSISTDTGGVSSAIVEGKNGFLLPPSATGKDYASLIASLYKDAEQYSSLAKESRNIFEQRANWDKWAETFKEACIKTISETK